MGKLIFKHERVSDWGREVEGKGGTTLATLEIPVEDVMNLKVGEKTKIPYGFALCSVKDNFCKAVGRNIAEKRLQFHEMTLIRRIDDLDPMTGVVHSELVFEEGNVELRFKARSDKPFVLVSRFNVG